MPSAYTEKLYNGEQSFEDFVLRCTRAMGAMIMFRDTSLDAKITEESFEESSYHDERLEEAYAEMNRLTSASDDELQAEVDRINAKANADYEQGEATRLQRKARYEAMLARVRAWEPPTEDHVNFKDWMINQLNESIDFDCTPHSRTWYPTYKDVSEYRARAVTKCARDIEYHSKHAEEDAIRNQERLEWWKAVVESLEG